MAHSVIDVCMLRVACVLRACCMPAVLYDVLCVFVCAYEALL